MLRKACRTNSFPINLNKTHKSKAPSWQKNSSFQLDSFLASLLKCQDHDSTVLAILSSPSRFLLSQLTQKTLVSILDAMLTLDSAHWWLQFPSRFVKIRGADKWDLCVQSLVAPEQILFRSPFLWAGLQGFNNCPADTCCSWKASADLTYWTPLRKAATGSPNRMPSKKKNLKSKYPSLRPGIVEKVKRPSIPALERGRQLNVCEFQERASHT